MLTNKAIFEETEAINKIIAEEKDPYKASMMKLGTLAIKMLSSMRTNQVLTMEKLGVTKLQPRKTFNDEAKPTK